MLQRQQVKILTGQNDNRLQWQRATTRCNGNRSNLTQKSYQTNHFEKLRLTNSSLPTNLILFNFPKTEKDIGGEQSILSFQAYKIKLSWISRNCIEAFRNFKKSFTANSHILCCIFSASDGRHRKYCMSLTVDPNYPCSLPGFLRPPYEILN